MRRQRSMWIVWLLVACGCSRAPSGTSAGTPASFVVALDRREISAEPGSSSGAIALSIVPAGGFDAPVSIEIADLPPGLSAEPARTAQISPGEMLYLTLRVAPEVAVGKVKARRSTTSDVALVQWNPATGEMVNRTAQTRGVGWLASTADYSRILVGGADTSGGLAVYEAASPKVSAQGTDPLAILKASFAAANAGDVAAALAFYGDDAVLVNTRGARFSGKESIRKFIQANVEHKVQAHVQNLSPQVHGETVTLTDKYTTDFFERWGVGYVEFKTDVVVREGKIRSQINYITFAGLLKIKRACDTPKGRIIVAGTSCDDFLRRAMAQTETQLRQSAASPRSGKE